ncbi:LacI family DNA-binding transcriptional regulator [soil metagenome]
MTGRVTIYHVAQQAGVSISTVSLAMNSPSRVSEATRSRIYDVADALGFEPKTEAITRARRGVGRIGVLAPFSSYPSYYERLSGVLRAVRDEPLEVVVLDHESAATAPSPHLASLPFTGRMDGLIVMGMPLDDDVARRLSAGPMPTVLVDIAHDGFDAVETDDVAGGQMVAAHVCDVGYRHHAFIGEEQQSQLYASPCDRRLDGFGAGLAARGHRLSQRQIIRVPNRREAAEEAGAQLLAKLHRPCAIFAHDDLLAAGVLQAAKSLGLRVPHEVGIVGFDDSELAHVLGLTSVRQPLVESGTTAVRLLLDRLRQPDWTARNIRLELRLMARATTAIA